MKLPLNQVLCGDCQEIMAELPEDSIDLVVTSPPYWGLRDYGLGKDQLGLEAHPQQYINSLVEISREIKRVLSSSGSYWLNLGDTYCTGKGKSHSPGGDIKRGIEKVQPASSPNRTVKLDGAWLQPKQLLGIPWRVAAALQNDGWILRNCVTWYKPNHMPSSVKDRLTNSYEFIFFLVKQRKYYFNLDEIRVPHQGKPSGNKERKYLPDPRQNGRKHFGRNIPWDPQGITKHDIATDRKDRSYEDPLHLKAYNLTGKNPGDLWSIPTYPFKGAHFAVFPPSLIEPIIKAGCPRGGVVLDPFAGSGTALRVARKLGRRFIGIEINPSYAEMCERRVRADAYNPPLEGVPTLTELLDRE